MTGSGWGSLAMVGMGKRKLGRRRGVLALVVLLVVLGGQGCGPRYRTVNSLGRDMNAYAKERYAQALHYMERSRYELAAEQFAIAERTAVSPKLQELAREGHAKAEAVIKAKR